MIERKCLQCGTWNNEEDYCKSCEAPLSPKALDKVEDEKRIAEEANRKPSKVDVWLKKAKNHRFFLVRVAYQFLYGIGVVMGLFGAFLAWLVAMANA